MPYIMCMILLKSACVMLFAIAYATYYCYFPFLPLFGSIYTTLTMATFVILALFHTVLHHFIFITQLFPGNSGLFPGVSNHFYFDIYFSEHFLGHFTLFCITLLFCHFHFLSASGPFLGISEHFWYSIYCSEHLSECFACFCIILLFSPFVSWSFPSISSLFYTFLVWDLLFWTLFRLFLIASVPFCGISEYIFYHMYCPKWFLGCFSVFP